MIRKIVIGLVGLAAVLGLAPAAFATGTPSNLTVIGTPGDLAVGSFHRHLVGVSDFTDTTAGSVSVYGTYAFLRPGQAYFTVVYGNGNCDPAQAFPVGPFYADSHGRATFAANVPLPIAGLIGGTMSMSVRYGDDATDQDHDGKTGPTDVVAVPGSPKIGLVQCDYHPRVLDL